MSILYKCTLAPDRKVLVASFEIKKPLDTPEYRDHAKKNLIATHKLNLDEYDFVEADRENDYRAGYSWKGDW